MDYKKASGWSLIGLMVLMTVTNVADAWQTVQNWEGALSIFTPAFVSVLLKGFLPALMGTVGGMMLPSMGPVPVGEDRRGILRDKIADVREADAKFKEDTK